MADSRHGKCAAMSAERSPEAIAWATQQSQLILQSGVPLMSAGLAVALAIRVKHPERIRVWTVIAIPTPMGS